MEETGTAPDNETGDEISTRRQFLKWATGILTLLCGAIVGIPLLGSLFGPAFRATKTSWIKVGDIGTLPLGQPISLKVVDVQTDAYVRESVIRHLWAIRHSGADVTVFSPTCTHLGCQYTWNAANGHFECPCHESVYALDGTVLGGPAPRRLDTLSTRMEKNDLYVEWKRFKSGDPEKHPV
jgi:menaquinol-cytochrome c reductase iron-sulfur subunit